MPRKRTSYDAACYYDGKLLGRCTKADSDAYTLLMNACGGDAARVLREYAYFSPELKAILEKAALTFAASSIICAFGLTSAAPRSPYRHLELCGIALIHPPLFPFSPLLFFFIHPFCFPSFHLSAHLLFQQTCNKKRAHQVGGRGKSAYRIF